MSQAEFDKESVSIPVRPGGIPDMIILVIAIAMTVSQSQSGRGVFLTRMGLRIQIKIY